jgi:membrane associated rhomboid family serine protease
MKKRLGRLRILFTLLMFMWLVFMVNETFVKTEADPGGLNNLGIQPLNKMGLWGILFSPFLHVNTLHILGNTIPYLIFGSLIVMRSANDFVRVSIISALVAGLGVWVVGQPGSIHVGASGMIFGYFAFLLSYGWYARKFFYVLLSIIIALLFGGMLQGIVPQGKGISWEGHLFGFVGGLMAARGMADREQRMAKD